jgi:hypothetical protein
MDLLVLGSFSSHDHERFELFGLWLNGLNVVRELLDKFRGEWRINKLSFDFHKQSIGRSFRFYGRRDVVGPFRVAKPARKISESCTFVGKHNSRLWAAAFPDNVMRVRSIGWDAGILGLTISRFRRFLDQGWTGRCRCRTGTVWPDQTWPVSTGR